VGRLARTELSPRLGFTIWVTGLPAAGKTTLSKALVAHLEALGLSAALLDGDVLRQGISRDLGYDPASRAESARRAAEHALNLALQRTVAVVALVSPYEKDRNAARAIHCRRGVNFLEVHLATPLIECERRDPKGLYARGRRGQAHHVTGLDAPYETPKSPDLTIGKQTFEVEEHAAIVLAFLRRAALIPDGDP